MVGRIEVGIANLASTPLPDDVDEGALLSVALSTLALPVRVPDGASTSTTGPLVAQGRRLARLYEFATTSRRHREIDRQPRLVEDGLPMLLVELRDDEPFRPPAQATVVDPARIGGAKAVFMWLRSDAGRVPVWFLARGAAQDGHLRQLRLCLLRLHAEQQALDLVLKQLARGTINYVPEDDPGGLSEYLNEATRRINRSSWGGISQSAILDAFGAAETVRYDDQWRNLMVRLDGAHRQVKAKTEAYWRERTAARVTQVFNTQGGAVTVAEEQFNFSGVFHGNVVGKVEAERIDNSFNTVANSSATPEMKEALTELHEQVKALLKEAGAVRSEGGDTADVGGPDATGAEAAGTSGATVVPGDQAAEPAGAPSAGQPGAGQPSAVLTAEELMGYLEALTQQALASQPLKDVLELAARKLVDAARTVATRVAPITAAVSTVLRIVGIPVPF